MFKLFGLKKEKAAIIPDVASQNVTENPSSNNGGELSDRMPDKKLVAIVTAAIAASRDESDCAFNVISINKIS